VLEVMERRGVLLPPDRQTADARRAPTWCPT